MSESFFTATQGNIRIPNGKRLDVGPGGTLSVAPGATLSVTSGGTLSVAAGGTLSAAAGSTVTTAGTVTLNDPSYFRAAAGESLLNHLAIDEPMFRFYFADFATPTDPACYFSADGGFYTGSTVTINAANSRGVQSGYTGDQVIYYRPMCWTQESANYLNHPAATPGGYTPLATYMFAVQNDINGPSILSVQQGSNAGGANPQGAMFLGCVNDFLSQYAKVAIHHDYPAGVATTDNTWLMFGSVNLTTVCLDEARGGSLSATNYDDAFDAMIGRNGAKVLAVKGNGANGAAIELREFSSATPTTDADAPADGRVVLYCRDNGAGKEQLCARFASGAVQVLATEP